MSAKKAKQIPLSTQQRRFVDRQVRLGRYSSATAVVRDGLRLLQEWDQFLDSNRDAVRRMIEEGASDAERGNLLDGEKYFAQWKRRNLDARRRAKALQKRRVRRAG